MIKVGTSAATGRKWAPVVDGRSVNFLSVNRSKRGMTLNLKRGRAGLLKALVEIRRGHRQLPASRRQAFGRRRRHVARGQAALVHVTISGYSHVGPLAAKPGCLMLQAFSGMMAMTGERDGGPIRAGASFIDMATGMLAFAGVTSNSMRS